MDQHLTAATSWNRKPNLSVRLSDIPFDRRAVSYIESVCRALIEDRFGPGCSANFVIVKTQPELEPAVNYDLMNAGIFLGHELPIGRNAYLQMETAIQRAKALGLINPGQNGNSGNGSNDNHPGRGSPNPQGRMSEPPASAGGQLLGEKPTTGHLYNLSTTTMSPQGRFSIPTSKPPAYAGGYDSGTQIETAF